MSLEKIILIGGGGHCRSVIDVIENTGKYIILGIVDEESKKGQKINGYDVIGSDDDLPLLSEQCGNFHISVGQIKSFVVRQSLFLAIKRLGAKLPIIIANDAYVASSATLGEGTIIMQHAMVNANAIVGENCIINTKALLEHDCEIGNYCHVSTGAILNGGVKIGKGVFIGSGSVVNQEIEIGRNCVIGSGSVVISDIEEDAFYMGNPAQKK
jgi:sugar O-acyltransferase (sialic acid O-acetyltransferase NeuD family)